MASGTVTFAQRADLVGGLALGVPVAVELIIPVPPVAISIPSLIVSIPRTRAGT